jgi:hypothetical protein
MGTLIGAVLAVIAGMAVSTAAVVGVVQTVKDEPKAPVGQQQTTNGQVDVPLVGYGSK